MPLVALDLAPVVIAMVAALLAFAATQLIRWLLGGTLGNISILGVNPFGFLVSAAESAAGAVVGLVEDAIEPITDVVTSSVSGTLGIWGQVRNAMQGTIHALYDLATYWVPDQADAARDAAIGWAEGAIGQEDAAMHATVDALGSNLHASIDALGSWAQGAIDGARTDAIGWAQGAIDELKTYEDGRTRFWVDALTGDINDLSERTGAAIDGIESDLRGAEERADAATAALGKALGAVAHGLEEDIASGDARTAATAAAATAAVAATVTTWLEECGDPLCENLNPFGNGLSDLLSLLSTGLLFAVIEEAVRDPAGAARATQAAGDPFVRGVRDLVATLAG